MSSPPPQNAANDAGSEPEAGQWADIVQQLGAEIAGPLSAAMERIHQLIATGQIDRQGLRALRESVAMAREAGMAGQQLARLASGRLRLARERLHLTQVLRSVLAHRSRETQARGIQVRQALRPVEVIADGSLLFSLLNALMDWALASTHSSIDLRLDLTPWPARALLTCRFAHRSLDLVGTSPKALRDVETPPLANSLAWRLVEQTAITMGLVPLREDEAGITVLTLEFPHTVGEEIGSESEEPAWRRREIPTPPEPHFGDSGHSAFNSKPLAGSHVLIVTPRRELRNAVQEAIAHMGLIVDVAATMAEARQFCQEGLPHGILFETAQRGADFAALHEEVQREVPHFCFVELLDHEHQTQLSTATPDGLARISRQHLADALASLLTFELSKGL
ncbi:MAG: hypothetical protein JO006_16725 [Paucibacter sp.]|nr:hypothetical protein [Roseateles sp.]